VNKRTFGLQTKAAAKRKEQVLKKKWAGSLYLTFGNTFMKTSDFEINIDLISEMRCTSLSIILMVSAVHLEFSNRDFFQNQKFYESNTQSR